jgi:hypothetical protein
MKIESEKIIEGFKIPIIDIQKGTFLRFWIGINVQHNKNFNLEKFLNKTVIYLIQEQKSKFIRVKLIKENLFFRIFFPEKVKCFFQKNNINLNIDDIIKLGEIGIDLNSDLKSLNHRQIKVLSIYTHVNKNENVIFDYFGLGPNEEKFLTNYLQKTLPKKRIIALDNLDHLSDKIIDDKIININIVKI